MHDVDGGAGRLRERDGPAGRLGFARGRAGEGVELGPGFTLREGAPDENLDHPGVFGVHADEAPVSPRAQERAQDRRVIRHQAAGIGHVELERRDAFRDQSVHFLDPCLGQVHDADVKGVVHDGLALRFLAPGVEGPGEGLALFLGGEVDDRGRAAEDRAQGARSEVVRRPPPREGHVEMGVRVDAAGDHHEAARVDDVRRAGELGSHGRDPPPLDGDVRDEALGRGDERAALDEEVVGHGIVRRYFDCILLLS